MHLASVCQQRGHVNAHTCAPLQLSEEEFVNAPPSRKWGRAEEMAQDAGVSPPEVVRFLICHLAAEECCVIRAVQPFVSSSHLQSACTTLWPAIELSAAKSLCDCAAACWRRADDNCKCPEQEGRQHCCGVLRLCWYH